MDLLSNMLYKIGCIYHKIKKIIKLMPVLWADEDWDYSYIYVILLTKLRNVRVCFENTPYGCHRKDVQRIRVCELLLERLVKDEYWPFTDVNRSTGDKRLSEMFHREEALKKQDLELFGKYFAKYSRTWWD